MKNLKFGETNVSLNVGRYYNGNLYIGLITDDYEPYCNVTANLSDSPLGEFYGYVDTNNYPALEKFIIDNRIGEFTGQTKQAGYYEYPLFRFNIQTLDQYRLPESWTDDELQ